MQVLSLCSHHHMWVKLLCCRLLGMYCAAHPYLAVRGDVHPAEGHEGSSLLLENSDTMTTLRDSMLKMFQLSAAGHELLEQVARNLVFILLCSHWHPEMAGGEDEGESTRTVSLVKSIQSALKGDAAHAAFRVRSQRERREWG